MNVMIQRMAKADGVRRVMIELPSSEPAAMDSTLRFAIIGGHVYDSCYAYYGPLDDCIAEDQS